MRIGTGRDPGRADASALLYPGRAAGGSGFNRMRPRHGITHPANTSTHKLCLTIRALKSRQYGKTPRSLPAVGKGAFQCSSQ